MIHKLFHIKLSMFFSQLTLLSNNLVLSSYLSSILLRIMVLLVMGRSAENIEERKKTDRKKLKSEEKVKQRIPGQSNKSNIHLRL